MDTREVFAKACELFFRVKTKTIDKAFFFLILCCKGDAMFQNRIRYGKRGNPVSAKADRL